MSHVSSGELWLEGSAENKKEALANAIAIAPEIPAPRKGMKIAVFIDTIWQDDEGDYHAKVMFQEVPDPNAEIAKVAHDHILEPENDNDTALKNTKTLEQAEEKVEEDFVEAVNEKTKEKKHKADLKSGEPVPAPEGTEEKEEGD